MTKDYYIDDKKLHDYFGHAVRVRWGNWGGWSLVVVYRNSNDPLQFISLYDGFKFLIPPFGYKAELEIKLPDNSFYTPPYGDIKSKTIIFSAGAERKIDTDYLYIYNKDEGYKTVSNAKNPENNIMNDTISYLGQNISNFRDFNPGIDLDVFDTSNILAHGQTTTKIKITMKALKSMADQTFVGFVGIANEVYEPKICYLETLYDKNGNEINGTSIVKIGDTLTAEMTLRNIDYETARNVRIIRTFDDNETSYVTNSVQIKDLGYHNLIHIADNHQLSNDNLEVTIDQGTVGDVNETNVTIGPFGLGDDNEFPPWESSYPVYKKEAILRYQFHAETSGALENIYNTHYYFNIFGYTGTVEGTLPKCTDFNNTYIIYEPNTGVINVTNPNFSGSQVSTDANSSQNALYTQVAGTSFATKAIALKHPPALNETSVPLKRSHALAELELVKAIGNTACKNAIGVHVTQNAKQLIYFNDHNSVATTFTAKKASRGVRFRARYFKWINLMSDHSVHCLHPNQYSSRFPGVPQCLVRGNSRLKVRKLKKIFGQNNPCFTNALGNPCRSSGRGSRAPYNKHDGTDCLACLMDHSDQVSYSCSMDAFAIRPATYAIDVNDTFLIGKRSYRLDINATPLGSTQNLADYNVTFTSSNADTNITTKLLPKPGCQGPADANETNNLSGTNVVFSDGAASTNSYTFHDIGEVNLSIVDNYWTKIDQNKRDRHNNIVNDCIPNSASNSPSSGKVGCMTRGWKKLEFHPKDFNHTVALTNFIPAASFTYLSNDPNMYARYDITITARLADDSAARNYVKSCYARDINSTLNLLSNQTLGWSDMAHRLIFFDDPAHYSLHGLGAGNNYVRASSVTFDVKESNFTTGSMATIPLRFNIERNVSIPDLPIIFHKNDYNISTSEKPYTGAIKLVHGEDFDRSSDTNITFVYGRLDTNNEEQNTITGSDGNVTVLYEIYNPLSVDATGNIVPKVNLPLFGSMTRSPNNPNWLINNQHTLAEGNINNIYYQGTNVFETGAGTVRITQDSYANGKHALKLHYGGSNYPYLATMDVNTSDWLVYNKYNQNAATVPLHTKFIRAGKWMGVGSDINGTIESNQSQINRYRIDW